jgi:uncharacterized delta-60 repeat protein
MPPVRSRNTAVVAAVLSLATPIALAAPDAGTRRAPSKDWAYALAIQQDGKLIAAGRSVQGRWYFALARFTATGTLDPTFGRRGKVVGFESGSPYGVTALELQRDGKLIATGHASLSAKDVFALARYTTRGLPDPRFGRAGRVLTRFASRRGTGDTANAVAIQSDGKLVVTGNVSASAIAPERIAIARYQTNGELDPTFGSGGKVTVGLGVLALGQAIAVQRDGKIVVAGWSVRSLDARQKILLLRLTARGTLDPSFGNRGKVLADIASSNEANAVAVLPDGRIVVGGTAGDDFALLRFTPGGRLDPSFGSGGKVVTTFGVTKQRGCADCESRDSGDKAFSLAVQPDGKIVLAGATDVQGWLGPETYCCAFTVALARYDADGSLDSSFGTDGKVVTLFDRCCNTYAQDVAIQADGKIAVAGGGGGYFALGRYTSDGRLDASFGSGGKVKMRFKP